MNIQEIFSIERVNEPITVWDVKVTPSHFFVANDIITHNKTADPCAVYGVYTINPYFSWTTGHPNSTTEVQVSVNDGEFQSYFTYPIGTTQGTVYGRNVTFKFRLRHVSGSIRSAWVTTNNINIPVNGGTCCYETQCLTSDTNILLASGEVKLIEELVVGDVIASVDISNLPEGDQELLLHTRSEITPTIISTTVTSIEQINVPSYLSINNGQLKMTDSHINMIYRDKLWHFVRGHDLRVGDLLPKV